VRQNQFAVDNRRDRSNLYWHPATAVYRKKKRKEKKKTNNQVRGDLRNVPQSISALDVYNWLYIIYYIHNIYIYIGMKLPTSMPIYTVI